MSTTPTTLAEIRETLPGHTEHLEQLDAVKAEQRRRASTAVGNPYADLSVDVLREMLAAGEPLDDLDERVAQRQARGAAAVAANEALTSLRKLLETELRAIESNPGELFPRMNAALQDICAELTTLEPLREISTPEAALGSRRLDDAERLSTLLGQVSALRAEQLRILRDNGDDWASKLSVLRVISNVEAVFDDAAVWLSPGHLVHRTRNEQKQVSPPWPSPLQTAVATSEFTAWALKSGARMWIPSPDEYETAVKALRTKSRLPRTDTREGEWVDPGPGQHTPARSLSRGRARSTQAAHVIS